MTEFNVLISGERAIAGKFDSLPTELREYLKAPITEITEQLYALVVGKEPEKTGALRADTLEKVGDFPEKVVGRVWVSDQYAKAGALEYGAHRNTKVRQYSRTQTQAFGRLIAPTQVFVNAYSRTPDITADRYLRDSLESMRPEAEAVIQSALDEFARIESET